MKTEIHPEYVESTVTCSCGNTFQTRSTVAELHVELCNECHPFFTGKQKLVDSGGRVERFRKRYAKAGVDTDLSKQATAKAGVDTDLSKQATATPAEDETSADTEA